MYKLHTRDAFMFRGNGSFTAGENAFARGVFPPNPQTIYGALRGNWIDHTGNYSAFYAGDYREIVGTPTEHGSLQLKGIYLIKNQEIYIPLPLDSQVIEGADEGLKAQALKLVKGSRRQSDNQPYRLMGRVQEKSKSANSKWMKAKDWEKFINVEPISVYGLNHFIVEEAKLGIARDPDTRSARLGLLYQVQKYKFLEGASLAIEATEVDNLSVLSMGHKGTLWTLTKDDSLSEALHSFKTSVNKSLDKDNYEYIRVSLLTPALAREELLNEEKEKLRWFDFPYIAQASQRPEYIGGWDIVKKEAKARYACLSSGTSFILSRKSMTTSPEEIKALMENVYSDVRQEEGYGRVIISPVFIEQ